jgi:phage gp29-like protein
LVNVPPKTQPLGAPGAGTPQFTELITPQDAADVVVDGMAAQAMNVTDEIYMAPLKRLVEKAASLEELRDSIIDLYDDMSPADLGVLIARAMAVAELAGMAEVQDEAGVK